MKKKLLLETVLKLKDTVEKSITTSYEDIIKYNFEDKSIQSLAERVGKLESQLIHLKQVIQEANKGKLKGITNNFNIYYLSNLKAKQLFYKTLLSKFGRSKKRDGLAQLTKEGVITRSNVIAKEIQDYQSRLTTFNAKKKVTVILDESLNLM
jgi:hypothetical protein